MIVYTRRTYYTDLILVNRLLACVLLEFSTDRLSLLLIKCGHGMTSNKHSSY